MQQREPRCAHSRCADVGTIGDRALAWPKRRVHLYPAAYMYARRFGRAPVLGGEVAFEGFAGKVGDGGVFAFGSFL